VSSYTSAGMRGKNKTKRKKKDSDEKNEKINKLYIHHPNFFVS